MNSSFMVDQQIIEAVKGGDFVIEDPGGRKLIYSDGRKARDAGLDAHGYVLHARRIYSRHKAANRNEEWINLKTAKGFTFQPKELILIETYERISLSRKICGTIHSLARLTLLGFSHISTTVHPGWSEAVGSPQPLRIAIYNMGDLQVEIRDKHPIARMLLHQSEVGAEISAPTPEEVFQRADIAMEQYSDKTKREKRFMRISTGVVVTAVTLIIPSLLSDGFSLVEILKTIGIGLLALWTAYVFRHLE